jgi:hypothetical protein
MRLYELVIEDENTDEVFQISLVENPAIEAFGVFFNKGEVHFAEMEEEGLFMAPILIPDKKILRVDGEGLPYEVYFTSETIKRLAQMYLERKYQGNVNVEHSEKVNGVTLVESWIKESQNADKSKLYNLNVPVGSWIGTFKIDNEELREKFRKGELRAVSIEGLFEHMERTTPERMQSAVIAEMWSKHINELSEVEAEVVLSKIKEVVFEQPSITSTYPGEVAESGSFISPATFAEAPEMDVFGYETSHFYICPGAVGTFNHLVNEMNITDDDLVDMIRAAAVMADTVFMIEARVIESGKAEERDLRRATTLVEMFKDVFQTINERTGMEHDISYMDGHIEVIKSFL